MISLSIVLWSQIYIQKLFLQPFPGLFFHKEGILIQIAENMLNIERVFTSDELQTFIIIIETFEHIFH